MDSSSENINDSCEDSTEFKNPRIKSHKTRILARSQRVRDAQFSHSASDIYSKKDHGSDEDVYRRPSRGTLGSRALSHDSIFMEGNAPTEPEPSKVSSQENVGSKIKALQLKLQQQNLRLGPPPLVPPIRRPQKSVRRPSEDEDPPDRSAAVTGSDVPDHESISKVMSQTSPVPIPAPTRWSPLFRSHPSPVSTTSRTYASEPPLDFSSPPFSPSCLDTSAARHRMSVKPRNKRTSIKKNQQVSPTESHLTSNIPSYTNHSESVKGEEKHHIYIQESPEEEEEEDIYTSMQHIPSKSPKVEEVASEESIDLYSETSEVLEPQPQGPVDVTSTERPSSPVASEPKNRREAGFDTQVSSLEKRNTIKKTKSIEEPTDTDSGVTSELYTEGGWVDPALEKTRTLQQQGTIRPPRDATAPQAKARAQTQAQPPQQPQPPQQTEVQTNAQAAAHKQLPNEIKNIELAKRPAAGAGPVLFSITSAKTQDLKEIPRSKSFVGKEEQLESKLRTGTEKKFTMSLREKPSTRDSQPRESAFTAGKLTQDGAAPKSSDHSWERKDNQEKKDERPLVSFHIPAAGTATLPRQGSETREEEVEVAVDKQEEGEKTPFGIRLRSTSQSLRYRQAGGDPLNKQTRQDVGGQGGCTSKKTPANITPSSTAAGADVTFTDPVPSGVSFPVKNTLPGTYCTLPRVARAKVSDFRETEPSSSEPPEPPPAPQTAPAEGCWIDLALEKTRTLQRQGTIRSPRDATAPQAAAGAQTQAQPPQQTEVQTNAQAQAVKLQQGSTATLNQAPAVAVKAATAQGSSSAPTFKPPLVPPQQKTTSAFVKYFHETQTKSPQTSEPQIQSGPTHCWSQPFNKTWTTQSASHISNQTETSSPLVRETDAQPPALSSLSSGQSAMQQLHWSFSGLQPASQLKSTAPVPVTSVTTAPPSSVSASGREEKEVVVQEKGVSAPLAKRTFRDRPGSGRAAFQQIRAEWTSMAATTEVDAKKTQTDTPSPDQPVTLIRTFSSTGTKPEWKQGVKLSDPSPAAVPDRTREDKWIRKNVGCSTSLPTQSSVLQSMSDNAQPCWMELAKRKSMAWSDKTMD